MWTYLIIFLSTLCLLIIFGRRFYLVIRKEKEIAAGENGGSPAIKEEIHGERKGGRGKLGRLGKLAKLGKLGKLSKYFSKDEKAEMERLYNRSLALLKKNLPKEAVKILVQALAINPDYLDAQKELGKLYLDQKMWGKAAAVYKYLAERTKDPVDYSHLGLSLYNAGELAEAAGAYQQAVTLDPTRSQRYISLGQVYKELGNEQLALIAFNKALELDPLNVDYLLLAADTQFRLGGFVEAKSLLNRVLEIAPMSKIAKKILGEVEEAEKGKG